MEKNYETYDVCACVGIDQRGDDASQLSFELSIIIGYNLVQVHYLLLASLSPILIHLYLGIHVVYSLYPMQLPTGLTGCGVLQSLLR